MTASRRIGKATLRVDQIVCLSFDAGELTGQLSATIDAISSNSLILRLADSQPVPGWLQVGQALNLAFIDWSGLHRATVTLTRILDERHCKALVISIPSSIRTTQNRESVRVPANFSAPYAVTHSFNPGNLGKTDEQAVTHDLSAGGCRILSRLALDIGDRIRVELNPQRDERLVSVRIPPNPAVTDLTGIGNASWPSASRFPPPPRAGSPSGPPSTASTGPSVLPSAAPSTSASIRSLAISAFPSSRTNAPALGRNSQRSIPSQFPLIKEADDAPLELDAEIVRVEAAPVSGEFWIAARFLELQDRDQSRLARIVNDLQRRERNP